MLELKVKNIFLNYDLKVIVKLHVLNVKVYISKFIELKKVNLHYDTKRKSLMVFQYQSCERIHERKLMITANQTKYCTRNLKTRVTNKSKTSPLNEPNYIYFVWRLFLRCQYRRKIVLISFSSRFSVLLRILCKK